MDRDACPGRARVEQRGPPRCHGFFFVVGVLARAIKHILLHRTGENSYCGVHASRGAAQAPAHVVPDSAGGLRWRLVKIHWRSEAQSEYKQILFAFRTGQVLNTDLEVGAAGNLRCMTSAAFSNLDSK